MKLLSTYARNVFSTPCFSPQKRLLHGLQSGPGKRTSVTQTASEGLERPTHWISGWQRVPRCAVPWLCHVTASGGHGPAQLDAATEGGERGKEGRKKKYN